MSPAHVAGLQLPIFLQSALLARFAAAQQHLEYHTLQT